MSTILLSIVIAAALTCWWVRQSYYTLETGRRVGDLRMNDFLGSSDNHVGGLNVVYHRTDYFSFFRSLGDVSYPVRRARDGSIVCGACFVRRDTPVGVTWYVADYRVRQRDRGKRLGLHLLLNVLPWCVLSAGKVFGLTMGSTRAKYLALFRCMTQSILVRFHVIKNPDINRAIDAVPRYSERFVIDRTGQKDLYIEGKRLDILHMMPNSAPPMEASRLGRRRLAPDDAHKSFMLMLLPTENLPPDFGPPLLQGNLVCFGFSGASDFTWLGSGDL